MAGKKAGKKERSGKAKPFRERFNFWLDLSKQVEYDLADAIHQLKHTRQFASTVRDGLRLILTLRLGDTSVLESLFPGIVKQLVAANTNHELVELRKELADLRDRVATAAVVAPAESRPALSGLKKTAINLDDGEGFAPRVREMQIQDTDDTLVVKKHVTSEAEVLSNFKNSFLNFCIENS